MNRVVNRWMLNITKKELNFYLLLFGLLWGYIWLRAIFTQMTHDETANFFRFVHTGDVLPYRPDTSATNHLLNSFIARLFYLVFGAEPWALRMGNVLFFPVYFYFLIKLASLIKSTYLRIGFVVALSLTHNLIEFFAMSRGYGHSMALLLGSLWFLLQAFHTVRPRDYFLTLLFASLALTANLTLLNSVLLIIAFLLLRLVAQQKFGFGTVWQHLLIIIFLGIGPVAFYAGYLFYLREIGDLYYGETTGFWQVTVKTLTRTILDPGGALIRIFVGIYFMYLLASGSYLFFRNFDFRKIFHSHLLFLFFLLGNFAAVVLLKYIFLVNYPEDRTGLYFVVYFIGSLFFITDYFYRFTPKKILLFALLPLFYIPFHFFLNINLTHNSFENQRIPESFYQKMLQSHQPGTVPPTIGGYMGRELRWAFINFKHGGQLGKVHGSFYPNTLEDFQIADSLYFKDWRALYDSVDYYKTSDFYLLKRKVPARRELLFETSEISSHGKIDPEYYRFFIIDADTLENNWVQIDFNLNFSTGAKPFKGWIVANSLDARNQQISYDYFPLEWLRTKWVGGNDRAINSMIVRLPGNIQLLNFYIWNKENVPFSVDEGWVKVYRFNEKPSDLKLR
jgi:hypothetical protein